MPSFFLLASWLFIIAAIAISWQAGDREDRIPISMVALASLVSAAAYSMLQPPHVLPAIITIDAILLAIIVRHALSSHKHWPLWFAGFHGATVFFEASAAMLPAEIAMDTWRIGAFWFIPAYFAMMIGLLLDQRQRITVEND